MYETIASIIITIALGFVAFQGSQFFRGWEKLKEFEEFNDKKNKKC